MVVPLIICLVSIRISASENDNRNKKGRPKPSQKICGYLGVLKDVRPHLQITASFLKKSRTNPESAFLVHDFISINILETSRNADSGKHVVQFFNGSFYFQEPLIIVYSTLPESL